MQEKIVLNDHAKPYPVPSKEEAMYAVKTLIAWAGDDPRRNGCLAGARSQTLPAAHYAVRSRAFEPTAVVLRISWPKSITCKHRMARVWAFSPLSITANETQTFPFGQSVAVFAMTATRLPPGLERACAIRRFSASESDSIRPLPNFVIWRLF